MLYRMSHCLSSATTASESPPLRSLMTRVGCVPLEIITMVSYLYILSIQRPDRLSYILVISAVMCIVLHGLVTA